MPLPTTRAPAFTIWRPLAEAGNVWHATTTGPGGVPLRSVAVRLVTGEVAVYSPIRGLGPAAHHELLRIGEPSVLIAPNHYHSLGLREYAAAYPRAEVIAGQAAVPRLTRLCRRAVREPAGQNGTLPAGVSWLPAPATRQGELWLSLAGAGGRTWIAGDGFFNIARTPRSPLGLLLRLLGICPGLRVGTSFRWLIRDRATYRDWLLDLIAREGPTTLVPCHGDVLADRALPARLRELAEQRL